MLEVVGGKYDAGATAQLHEVSADEVVTLAKERNSWFQCEVPSQVGLTSSPVRLQSLSIGPHFPRPHQEEFNRP